MRLHTTYDTFACIHQLNHMCILEMVTKFTMYIHVICCLLNQPHQFCWCSLGNTGKWHRWWSLQELWRAPGWCAQDVGTTGNLEDDDCSHIAGCKPSRNSPARWVIYMHGGLYSEFCEIPRGYIKMIANGWQWLIINQNFSYTGVITLHITFVC